MILASRSERRAQLLTDAGYHFVQVQPPFSDPATPDPDRSADPQRLAMDLALKKAQSCLSLLPIRGNTPSIIVAADTIIVSPQGRLIGQPIDRQDARRILDSLISQTHQVVTGVALMGCPDHQATCFADSTQVTIGPISHRQLMHYIDSQQWQGKAGGYNLSEIQDIWPVTVLGDPTTVIGLPMAKLARQLESWPTSNNHDQLEP